MPPIRYLHGLLPSIFGTSQADEPNAGTREQQQSQSQAEGNESMDLGGAKNKRVRDSADQQTPNKKQRRPSEDEYRLTGIGGGHAQHKPTPIAIPTNPPEPEPEIMTEQRKSKPTTTTRKPAGGFRAQNTLGNSQAGKANRPGSSNNQQWKSTARKTKDAMPGGRPAMVPLMSEHVGDGFAKQDRSSKRRKTTAQPPPSKQDIVEVSDDECSGALARGQVHAVNGVPLSSDKSNEHPVALIDSQSQSQPQPQSQSQPKNQSKYFDTHEARTVYGWTDTKRQRPPRRGSSNQRTPSQSSLPRNGIQGPTSNNNHYSADIDDLASPSKLPGRSPRVDSNTHQSKKSRPPIHLDAGFDEIERRKQDRDVKTMNGTVSTMYKKPTNSNQPSQSPTAQRVPATAQKTDETRLRKQFRRDESATTHQQREEQPRRHSVVRNMKPESFKGQRYGVDESPDQLAGDNTVISRKRTSEQSSRQASPSDLRPITFTSRGSQPTNGRSARSEQQSTSRSEDEEVRISLKRIISRGCVLRVTDQGGTIDMVWQGDGFEIAHNGKPYCIPHKKDIMTIGIPEAHNWQSSQGSTKVILKGSSNPSRSNGYVLLGFEDIIGRDECHDYLLEASKDTMKTEYMEPGQLEKRFNNLTTELQKDASKWTEKARVELAQQEKQMATKTQPNEERIIYEDSEGTAARPTSSRSKMQAGLKEIPEQLTKTHHIDQPTTRRSARQSKPAMIKAMINTIESQEEPDVPKWTQIHKPEPWHQSIVYPTQGAKRVTVDFQDLERLDEAEFLNDNIVGYALRRIEEGMAPEHKNKVHFFNSFFFTSLTNKNGRKAFNYDSVKKWTKAKDLFDIPYIVVPINENLHWYVAIICNLPELARKPVELGGDDSDAVATPSHAQQTSGSASPIKDPYPSIPDSQEADQRDKAEADRMGKLSLSDGDEDADSDLDIVKFGVDGKVVPTPQEAQDEELPSQPTAHTPARGGNKSKKRTAPPPRKYPVDRPTIIVLDSLNGVHTAQVGFLKDYVRSEADAKRGMTVKREDIQGMKAVGIPVQSNWCDCGLYLVGYVEEFAKDPQKFVNKVLTRQFNDESDFVSFDSSKKRDELRDDLLTVHREQDAARLEQKKAKKMEKVAAAAGTAGQASVTARASPADAHASTAQSSKAASPARAPSPKAPLAAPVEAESHSESRPGAALDTRNTAAKNHSAHTDFEVDDSQELETSVPRALVTTRSGGESPKSQPPMPNQGTKSSTTLNGEDEGEMLDSADGGEAAPQQKFHKVRSPEIENLGLVFQEHQRAARTSGTASPDKRS